MPMQRFPVKLPALWRQVFPGLVGGAVIARGWGWLHGLPFNWPQTLPLMVVAAVLVLVVYGLQPTRAGREGLLLMTAWGWRRPLVWSDIAEVAHARMVGLQPALRVKSHDGRVFWIARDTKNLAGLHALAVQAGGEQHPLALALATPLYRL